MFKSITIIDNFLGYLFISFIESKCEIFFPNGLL